MSVELLVLGFEPPVSVQLERVLEREHVKGVIAEQPDDPQHPATHGHRAQGGQRPAPQQPVGAGREAVVDDMLAFMDLNLGDPPASAPVKEEQPLINFDD